MIFIMMIKIKYSAKKINLRINKIQTKYIKLMNWNLQIKKIKNNQSNLFLKLKEIEYNSKKFNF